MPIFHSINEDLGIVISSYVGAITESDLLLSYQQLFKGGKWKPGFHEIVDTRDAHPNGITLNGLYNLSLLIKRYTDGKCERFKTAIITSDAIISGLAYAYKVFCSGSPKSVKVFKDSTEALKWIGVDGDAFPLLQHKGTEQLNITTEPFITIT